jgi:hypothetical protein
MGSTHLRMERVMGVKWPEDGGSTFLRNVGYQTTRCYIQKMAVYIVTAVLTSNAALFVAGHKNVTYLFPWVCFI